MERSSPASIRLSAAALLFCLIPLAGSACDADTGCAIALGEYFLSVPPGVNESEPLKAVIFFHGHRGSGKQVVRNRGLVERFHARGYAVIAPNGSERTGRNGESVRGWPGYVSANPKRDEIAFIKAMMADLERSYAMDWTHSLVTGFSSGGSMAWYVACMMGDQFGGYAPVAGALRRPRVDGGCPGGPVRLLHIHGFSDQQVPIEGRGIRDWHQGDVFDSVNLARSWNGCRSQPDEIKLGEPFRCRLWTSCSSQKDVQLCLHDGGHGMPKGWAELVLDWFEP